MPRPSPSRSPKSLLATAHAYDAAGRNPDLVYTDDSRHGAFSRVLHMLDRTGALKGRAQSSAAAAASAADEKAFLDGLNAGLGRKPAGGKKPKWRIDPGGSRASVDD